MNTSFNRDRGLTPGLKALLLTIGALLALIIILIWSFIIDRGRSYAEPSSTETVTSEEIKVDEADDGATAALEEARSVVAGMSSNPTCDAAETYVQRLATFIDRAEATGGVTDNDRQLVADVLDRTNSTCEKLFSVEVSNLLNGPGIPSALTSINLENDWITPERPASDQAQRVENFSTYDRNIHCLFRTDQVDCSIYAYTFPSEPATCETYTQTYFVGNTAETGADCEWRIISQNRVGDGEYASEKNACLVSENGQKVECWSQLTGKGFTLTRNGITKF